MAADQINYLGTLQNTVLQVIHVYNSTTALILLWHLLVHPNAEHSRYMLERFDASCWRKCHDISMLHDRYVRPIYVCYSRNLGWATSRLEAFAGIGLHGINSLSSSLVLWLNYPNIKETVKMYHFSAALGLCTRWFTVFPMDATGRGCQDIAERYGSQMHVHVWHQALKSLWNLVKG